MSITYTITEKELHEANLSQSEFLAIMLDFERIRNDIDYELGTLVWELNKSRDQTGINYLNARVKDPIHLAKKLFASVSKLKLIQIANGKILPLIITER